MGQAFKQGGQVGVVPPGHDAGLRRQPCQIPGEGFPDVVQVPVKIQVLPVEVGDHRHLGGEVKEGAVAFVGLGDKKIPPAQ